MDKLTGRDNVPYVDETGDQEQQFVEPRQHLPDFLDKSIDTTDGDPDKLELRRVIEHAAQFGGSLNLARTGASLWDLSPDVMAFLEQAVPVPVTFVILPPELEALPPCICQLRRLARVEMDAPKGLAFDFLPLQDLILIEVTNVPMQARLELRTPVHCNLAATWPDGYPVTCQRHEEAGEYTIYLTDARDTAWVRKRLSDLLDLVCNTHDPFDEIIEPRHVIEIRDVVKNAAIDGGILDLSKTGRALLKLPPEVMYFLEEACNDVARPLVKLVLPSKIEWVPPCIFELRHLALVHMDSPCRSDLSFVGLSALCEVRLTNVPWYTRVRLDVPNSCKVIPTYSTGRAAEMNRDGHEGNFVSYEIVSRSPNFNHAASFPNGREIECRHIALNVIHDWGCQDSLPPSARAAYQPLARVSSPSSISLTTPWEINAIHQELGERPVESYYVSHKNWPQFQQAMLKSMAEQGISRRYMLVLSLRHDTSVRLIVGAAADQGVLEHHDSNYTTISTKHAMPCEFTDLFTNAKYFRVIYSAGEKPDGDPTAPIAPFARVIVIPDPLDLRSGVAKKTKDIKLSLDFLDFDEAASPAFVTHLCQYGHSFFFPRLALHITTNPLLTSARCRELLQANAFVAFPLMYRAMKDDDDGTVLGLGQCMAAGFAKGLLTSEDVYMLAEAACAGSGGLPMAVRDASLKAIKAYGKALLELFRAKALSSKQIKGLMLKSKNLDLRGSQVQHAYKAMLLALGRGGALSKEDCEDILFRVFG